MSYNLRYYFTFYADRDKRNPLVINEYLCKISELDGVDAAEEIEAQESPVIIDYNNSSDYKMQPLRGSECTLNLIATENFQLQDLYTENEQKWLVEIYRNASLIWSGFIIPDGCQESFAFTPYTIQVNAVDGLGLIKNLSYVQNDGNFWLGKQSFLEVIYNCLNRLSYPSIVINTCVNIYPDSYTPSDTLDPLNTTFVDAQRFLKDDEINPMNCQEVMDSILRQWTACIIQSEGEWFIYRPNEAALSDTLVFRSYTDNVYTGTVSKNIKQLLGGYSQGIIIAPYFHILTDQLSMIERAYKNVSMSYKYGVKQNPDEELDNPTFIGFSRGCVGDPALPCDDVTIPGWTKTGTMYIGTASGGGLIFFSDGGTYPTLTNYYENNNTVSIDNGKRFKLLVDYENPDPLFGTDMNFVIKLNDGLDNYYLQTGGIWLKSIVDLPYTERSQVGTGGTFQIVSDIVPITGSFTKSITVRVLAPSGTVNDIIYTNISGFILLELGAVVGEIHTATQTGDFSFVPETIDVFCGDSEASIYLGAIYESDETTLTTDWKRRGLSESALSEPFEATKPFLRLAVEELQRMYAGPFVKFEGSIFNYFNPLSLFTIDLVDGRFMPVSLRYDLQANICKAVHTRISNTEIAMDYTLEPDYGETTKVTVK
ncbi:MAG: hypothetical protein WC380_00300 [Pedobacter sp.]|jgi:hypothetical protein